MYNHQIVLLTILFGCVLSSFQIYSPEQAKEMFNGSIHFTIANFGHIPYGSNLVAKIVLPQPKNLCQPDESLKDQHKDQTYFILGERGECKFTTKALNAQKSGARLAIIEDLPSSKEGVIMANDGYGYLVDIPSVFIGYEDGEKLKNIMKKINKDLIVLIRFETAKTDKALLNLWLDPNERHSFVLVRDFAEYYNKIKDHMKIDLFYRVMPRCLFCDVEDCLSTFDWCVVPHLDSPLDGRDIVKESLKQYFILQKDVSKWFAYMDQYDKECTIDKGFEECSQNLMKSLGLPADQINAQVQQQVKLATTVGDGSLLAKWIDSASKGNIVFYPDVSINNINYQGELIASDIFEMVCNSLTEVPQGCVNAPPTPPIMPIPKGSLVPTVILIIVLMTVGFFILVVVYRRVVRKEMQQQMSAQVNQMVSQYIAFYDKKEGESISS